MSENTSRRHIEGLLPLGSTHFGSRESSTGLWAFVAVFRSSSAIRIRVYSVLGRIVSCTIAAVECIEEIVEGSTLNLVAHLL